MITDLPIVRPVERIPSVASPLADCAWCWPTLHPGVHFPEKVSSTICPGHFIWMLDQAARRRAARNEVQHAR